MSSGRYYFPEIKGDDTLIYVAQLSKEILKEGGKIVEIFRKNQNILHGKLSEKISLLMKKNSQSIFDLSPNSVAICKGQKESSVRLRKSSADMSTPVKRISNLPRRYLSGIDTHKEAIESEMIVKRERRILSPKNTTETIIIESIVEVSDIGGEVFVSPITSKSPESINDSNAENKGYPCLDETTASDLTFISPYASKVVKSSNVANDESSHSGQTSEMLNRLNVDDCQSGILLEVNVASDYIQDNAKNSDYSGQVVENPDNYTTEQGSCELLDECLKIPNLAPDEKHTPSPVKGEEINSNISAESEIKVFDLPDEKVALAVNPDDLKTKVASFGGNYSAKQDCYEFLEENLPIPYLTMDRKNTPSPVKRAKISSGIATNSEIQVFASPDEKAGIAINPDENIKMEDASFRGNYTTKQDSCELLEERLTISKLTVDQKHTPSPLKQAKISCSIATDSEIQVFATEGEKVGIEINSDEDTEVKGFSFTGNKLDISPIGKSKGIETSEEKRKSPGQRKNKLFLRAIPRIIYSDDMDELDIELPSESDESPSPKTAGISRKDFRIGKTTDINTGDNSLAKDVIRNDVFDDSKVETLPEIVLQRKCSPLSKETDVCSSRNATETSSSPEDKSYISRKNSPSSGPIKSASPKAHEHRINPLNKSGIIGSHEKNSKPERPQTYAGNTPKNSLSPSNKISPKILKCQFSPSDKKSCNNTSESVTETNSPTGDKDYIPTKRRSPSTRPLKSISPKAHKHQISSLKKTSISSKKFSNPESPQTDADYTPKGSMSPSIKISPKISKCQFSPSDKESCNNSPETITEKKIPTGDIGYIPRNTMSPSSKDSTRIMLPKAHEHRISPSEKTSINSNIFSNQESSNPNIDYTPRNSISPSTKKSPKTSKFRFSPSDKKACINIPQIASENISPCKTEYYFPQPLSPSVSSLKAETSSGDHVDCIFKQDDGSDSNVVHCFMNKLTKHISMRDECMKEIFKSFSDFQKELNIFFLYVKRIAYVIEKIPTEGQVYNTEELANFTTDLTTKAHKLVEKINLWKTAGDSEVQSWIQYFGDVSYIKSHNEIVKTKTSPVEYMSSLLTYEKDLKSVWKKMDDLKIIEDSRRSSFSDTAHDFKSLIKLFIKCLIIIGVLKLRSKTSSKRKL